MSREAVTVVISLSNPDERRGKGLPRNSCLQEVTNGMREKGINNMDGSTEKNEEKINKTQS
jgi:hypothetical protein